METLFAFTNGIYIALPLKAFAFKSSLYENNDVKDFF